MSFVHLHVHTEYSLLDGFSNIPKLIARTKELGMPAIAITDHGTMFGVIEFYNAAMEAGVKPIIGLEAYLAARTIREHDPQEDKKSTHLLLLAQNETGYKNLLQIASLAQLEGFYYFPRIDHEILETHAQGLICTTGCMSAEVPRLLQQGQIDKADQQLSWYYDVFGAENFFVELQMHDIPELKTVNTQLFELGRRHNASYVATNDVHYINKSDARLQDIMLAIQTGTLLSDPRRMRMSADSYYLRSPQEMAELFHETPEAISNTLAIAERCNLDLGFKGYHLPHFAVPDDKTADQYLRELCEDGLKRRYASRADDPTVRERLDYELQVIHKMGFDTYFLIVWDLCRYAREQRIWYNARGSGNGSIVAYCLDITLVEPIHHGLIFERFLNPGRISMPDIDLDFRDDRRTEMLEYAANKFGEDRVAQIITFGTLGARAAIRDVGRVMDIPLSEVDRVAKVIPNIPGKPITIREALEEVPEFKEMYQAEEYLRDLIDTAADMEGVVRNAGTHAAGVVIADRPLVDYVPLHRPTAAASEASPIKIVTQFEMGVLDSLGMLKVDFLGLTTLSIMARACDIIQDRHNTEFNLGNIPIEDAETYALLGRGETAGVFQVEGSGMRRWLMQMKPQGIEHVIAMVALFRPGPMEYIPSYVKRMHGEEPIEYRHPLLEPIFKETYGFPVYQEQLMYAAMQLAGYSPPDADDLRKAIAKKIKDKLLKHREKFVHGAVARGIPEDIAGSIFNDWEEFARYGFNKSHAADYGIIAVQTGYLKCHYPVEYMTALLSVWQSDTTKVAVYAADCRRMGIAVQPPSVNTSGWDFTIEDLPDGRAAIRFGLGAVKNVGRGPVNAILEAREKGPFTDINDFARQVDLRAVGKRPLECLIRVGALDQFGTRSAMLQSLDKLFSISASHFKASDAGQISMFGGYNGINDEIVLPTGIVEASRREVLEWERELIGLYVSDHPLSPVMDALTEAVSHFSGQLPDTAPGEKVRVAGIVTRVRPHMTKTGKNMGFVTLEDLQGNIELVVFPRTWERFWELFEVDNVVLVDGKIDAQSGDPKVLVDAVTTDLKSVRVVETPAVVNVPEATPYQAPANLPSVKPREGFSSEAAGGTPVSGPAPRAARVPAPSAASVPAPSAASVKRAGPSREQTLRAGPPREQTLRAGGAERAGQVQRVEDVLSPKHREALSSEVEDVLSPKHREDLSSEVEDVLSPKHREALSSEVEDVLSPKHREDLSSDAGPAAPVEQAAIREPSAELEEADVPPPPDEFAPDWSAQELAPGGFVIESSRSSVQAGSESKEAGGESEEAETPPTEAPEEAEPQAEPAAEHEAPSPTVIITNEAADEEPVNPVTIGEAIASVALEAAPPEVLSSEAGGVLQPETSPGLSSDAGPESPLGAESNPHVLGEALITTPPYVLPPAEVYAGEELHMVTVILRTGQDKVRDNLRLRQCYGILISYSGHDRFALHIFERNRGYRVEFPNYTTTYCPELVARLTQIVGAENVIVEPLRLH